MDLNPREEQARFSFDFQVWRPSPTVKKNGCYSLVNNYTVRSISLPINEAISHVARVTPLPQDQLQFQPGDVLGFYVESDGTSSDYDNGVVLLNNGSHNNELVYFASIDITAQTSQSGSCPYPVGTSGVLDSTTRAAPVISINVATYYCTGSVSFLIPSVSVTTVTLSLKETPTISVSTTPNTDSLVTRVAVIIIIVCITIMIVITTLAIILTVKRHNVVKKTLNSTTRPTNSLTLANQVYGKIYKTLWLSIIIKCHTGQL